MNAAQIAYALALAGVFAWRGPSYGTWVLLTNMAATLAACLALDLGMPRTEATLTMMLIDFASGVALWAHGGLPRLLSLGYVVTIPIYAANVIAGLSDATTFAIVITIGFIQIVVAGIGTGSNDRGAGSGRRMGLPAVPLSRRVGSLGGYGLAALRRFVALHGRG